MSDDNFSLDDIRDLFSEDMRGFLEKIQDSSQGVIRTSWLGEAGSLGRSLIQEFEAIPSAILPDDFAGSSEDPLLSLIDKGTETAKSWVRSFSEDAERVSYISDVIQGALASLESLLECELADDHEAAAEIAQSQVEELRLALELLEGVNPPADDFDEELDKDPARLPDECVEIIWPEVESPFSEIVSRVLAHPFMEEADDRVLEMSFQSIELSAHAMCGSSALVGRSNLAEMTAILETAAGAARWLSRRMDSLRDSLRGSLSFLSMTASVGESEREDAFLEELERRAEVLYSNTFTENFGLEESSLDQTGDQDLEALSRSAESVDEAPTDLFGDEFSFSDDEVPSDEKTESAVDAWDDSEVDFDNAEDLDQELLDIFRLEAEETVQPMRQEIQALRLDPRNTGAAHRLERLYHTIKGAAATVGLQEISRCAAELEDSFDPILEGVQDVDLTFVDSLIEKSNHLLLVSGLPELQLGEAIEGEEAKTHSLELMTLFVDETEATVTQIEGAIDSIDAECPLDSSCYTRVCELLERVRSASALAEREDVTETLDILLFEIANNPETSVFISHCRQAIGELRDKLGRGRQLIEDSLETALSTFEQPLEVGRESVTLETGDVWEAFEIEVQEIMDTIDRDIVKLEEPDWDSRIVESLFREYHTLKGALNTVGLAPVGRVLHQVEDYLEALTQGETPPSGAPLGRFLGSIQETIRRCLGEAVRGFVEVDFGLVTSQIEQLRSGQSVEMPTRKMAPMAAGLSNRDSLDTEEVGESQLRKFIRVPTERLDSLMDFSGELMVNRARLMRRIVHLNSLRGELMASKKRLLSTVDDFRERYEFSGLERRTRSFQFASMAGNVGGESTRSEGSSYQSDLLESFSDLEMDRYEDINILARSLHEISNDINEISLQIGSVLSRSTEDTDTFSSIVSGLQSEITRARMIPIEQLFLRLRRPIKDAADVEGRDVQIAVFGESVTLDKSIVDQLYAPMLHVVRNCVSHGIETPDERESKGKPRQGIVTLKARQDSGYMILEISDDGAGLDLAKLHQKGVKLGLIPSDVPVDSPQVRDLIFVGGFSVRDSATAVAGRGVGCDVIRREVQKLNGQIEVGTEEGQGTTFTITLPLTLAVFKAMILEQQGQKFALPTNFSERILDDSSSVSVSSGGVDRIAVDGTYVTLRDLRDVFGGEGVSEEGVIRPTVLVRIGDQRLALTVDRIHGQEEIVVKSLGSLLSGHPMFSGVTISGDGELILIMDVPGLTQKLNEEDLQGPTRSLITSQGETPRESESDHRIKVLYIDDSLSVRKAAEKLLSGLGVDVTLAVDGVDGLDKIRTSNFDLVFSDLEMPRLNGYDLIRELRFIPGFRDLPVIVVTSRSGAKHRKQAEMVGASDYITKPFNKDVLRKSLTQWSSFVDEG